MTIPSSVTEIGCQVFYGCGSLTSVTIPSSVTKIEEEAFSGCGSLTITAKSGSYAWTYAKENDIPVREP